MTVMKDCRGSFFIKEGKKVFGLAKRMTLHLEAVPIGQNRFSKV